jgi:hypothetical protein
VVSPGAPPKTGHGSYVYIDIYIHMYIYIHIYIYIFIHTLYNMHGDFATYILIHVFPI